MKLLTANGKLDFVRMNILSPLPKTKQLNKYIVAIKDCESNGDRALPMSNTTESNISSILFDNFIFPYGTSNLIRTQKGPKLVLKNFTTLCGILMFKKLSKTSYNPQSSGQTEIYENTILASLRKYIVDNQYGLGLYVQPLTYAYKEQIYRDTCKEMDLK